MHNLLTTSPLCRDPIFGLQVHFEKERARHNYLHEKLEKGMASTTWFDISFPQAKLKHHTFTSSDHCQVTLDLSLLAINKVQPFTFGKMCYLRKD